MSPVHLYTDYHAWCDNLGCYWGSGNGSPAYDTRATANKAAREHMKECKFKPSSTDSDL